MKAASALTELTSTTNSQHHVPISDDDTASATTSQTRSYASSVQTNSSSSNSTVGAAASVIGGEHSAASVSTSNSSMTLPMTKDIFPQRLMRILSEPDVHSIITWLPHGRSFVIIEPEELAEKVLPKYFPESCVGPHQKCKYPSFTRKLNRWGFRQVTRGPDSGAFHHSLFLRDAPHLCLQMVCQRSKRRNSNESSISGAPVSSQHHLLNVYTNQQGMPRLVNQNTGNSNTNVDVMGAGYFHLNSAGNTHSSLKRSVPSSFFDNGAVRSSSTTPNSLTRTSTNISQHPYPFHTSSLMHINPSIANMNTVTSSSLQPVVLSSNSVSSSSVLKGNINTALSIMQSTNTITSSSTPALSAPPAIATVPMTSVVGGRISNAGFGLDGNGLFSFPTEMTIAPATSTSTDRVNTSTIVTNGDVLNAKRTAANDNVISAKNTAANQKSTDSGEGGPSTNEERIANAKNLLYDAYLKALG